MSLTFLSSIPGTLGYNLDVSVETEYLGTAKITVIATQFRDDR